MKFSVGDQVIGNKSANRYNYTVEGWMGVVTKVYKEGFTAKGIGVSKTSFDDLYYDYFDLYKDKEEIDSTIESDRVINIFLNSK